jgi:hypothetical protein
LSQISDLPEDRTGQVWTCQTSSHFIFLWNFHFRVLTS